MSITLNYGLRYPADTQRSFNVHTTFLEFSNNVATTLFQSCVLLGTVNNFLVPHRKYFSHNDINISSNFLNSHALRVDIPPKIVAFIGPR